MIPTKSDKLKKAGRWILRALWNAFRYEFFTFWLVYLGQRIASFITDPYMEDSALPFTMFDIILMILQASVYLMLWFMIKHLYRILFEKRRHMILWYDYVIAFGIMAFVIFMMFSGNNRAY